VAVHEIDDMRREISGWQSRRIEVEGRQARKRGASTAFGQAPGALACCSATPMSSDRQFCGKTRTTKYYERSRHEARRWRAQEQICAWWGAASHLHPLDAVHDHWAAQYVCKHPHMCLPEQARQMLCTILHMRITPRGLREDRAGRACSRAALGRSAAAESS